MTDQYVTKRRFPRKPFMSRVVLFQGDSTSLARAHEISEGGIMIHTISDLNVGDLLTLHFSVNDCYVRVKAEVVYTLPSLETIYRVRVGLKFQSISQSNAEHIREFVAGS